MANIVTMSVTNDENSFIKSEAKKRGLSVSKFLRLMFFEYEAQKQEEDKKFKEDRQQEIKEKIDQEDELIAKEESEHQQQVEEIKNFKRCKFKDRYDYCKRDKYPCNFVIDTDCGQYKVDEE